MFTQLEEILLAYAQGVPLEIFAFVASFIEEIIAPVPSPTVMIATGSIAAVQDYALPAVLLLAIIAAAGKTLGAIVVYFIADKAEDILIGRFGKFFDVRHEDIERLGAKLGNGMKDYLILTGFRALPFIPSSVVSAGCGLLKIPLRLYIITTFIGTVFRDAFYLYFGYKGIEVLGILLKQSESLESVIEALVILTIFTVLVILFIRKRKAIGRF